MKFFIDTANVDDISQPGIASVPYSVIEQMTKHPLTDAGIVKFQNDYRAVFGNK